MTRKNKRKINPSPTPPFSSPLPAPPLQDQDVQYFLSVLNLIPTAILGLVPVLSLEDREVLAYMITRSLDSPAKKLSSKTAVSGGGSGGHSHGRWIFQCECFDCYTAYWLRWESSPNRELIHQVIEAFEEHLATGKQLKTRDKRVLTRPDPHLEVLSARELYPEGNAGVRKEEPAMVEERVMDGGESPAAAAAAAAGTRNDHKGLARKVLPDVVGLFNSRLWKLWNPSM